MINPTVCLYGALALAGKEERPAEKWILCRPNLGDGLMPVQVGLFGPFLTRTEVSLSLLLPRTLQS